MKVGALLLAIAAVPAPARAQGVAGEVPLADVLEILVVDRICSRSMLRAAVRRPPGYG